MSSFKHRAAASTSQTLPEGTKPSPALSTLLLTSSGVPSLDDVLGGGIQLGTSLLILNPDPHSAHTDLLQKYFISQGLASDQIVHVFDHDAGMLVDSSMWVPGASTNSIPDDEEPPDDGEGKVKIAWRYENMQKFKTTVTSVGSDQYYCRTFDLSYRIPPDAIEAFLSAGLLQLENSALDDSEDVVESVIRRIKDIIKASEDLSATNKRKVVRLSIPAFSGPSWGDPTPQRVIHFLLRLRAELRRNQLICAFVTIPAYLSSDAWTGEGWLEKLAWVSDACITLSSSSADPSTAALFPSHHGLLRIHKLPCVQSLVSASDRFSTLRGLSAPTSSISSCGVGENNLAFKCTRKRFIIETFHLDIDGGVGERRTTPSTSSIAIQEGTSEKLASQHHIHHDHEHQSKVSIEMEINAEDAQNPTPHVSEERAERNDRSQQKEAVKKKPKKRVGFQVERPDIFDF